MTFDIKHKDERLSYLDRSVDTEGPGELTMNHWGEELLEWDRMQYDDADDEFWNSSCKPEDVDPESIEPSGKEAACYHSVTGINKLRRYVRMVRED